MSFCRFLLFLRKYHDIILMNKVFLIIWLVLLSVGARGQKRILMLDSDTRKPIKGVSVSTGKEPVATSNDKGIVMLSQPFDTIRFSHMNYSSEMLYRDEVRDTMLLFPKEHTLPEVTVTELAPEIKGMLKGWVAKAAAEGAALAPKGIASFDFASLIDKRRRRDKKHLKKAKEVLKEWDKKKDSE